MKKAMATLLCVLSFNSVSSAHVISFQDEGETTFLRKIIMEESDILTGQLSEYLTTEHQCTSIKMKFEARRKHFLSFKNLYIISGSADCPHLTRSSMMVDMHAGAGYSEMQIIFRDLNNNQIIKNFFTPARGE